MNFTFSGRCLSGLSVRFGVGLLLAWAAGFSGVTQAADPPGSTNSWLPLFNGRDLSGWKVKIKGYPLGENHLDTFRVENGVLRVAYDKYRQFDGKFGHLFFMRPFSHYRLRVEYRFVGEQTPGGPGWAWRNSGIMLHCQAPETMRVDQEFPVSIEVQLLGGDGRNERPTANLCTPGTHVVLNGRLHTQHCTNSRSKTFHGDQCVTVEVEVRGKSASGISSTGSWSWNTSSRNQIRRTQTPGDFSSSAAGTSGSARATSPSRPRVIRSSSARSS